MMQENGFIHIVKVKYVFKDGNEMQGLELNLAPKVKKFIHMNNDNLQLLKLMGNGLADWYNWAEFGQDIVLSAYTGKDKLVGSNNDNSVPINFN